MTKHILIVLTVFAAVPVLAFISKQQSAESPMTAGCASASGPSSGCGACDPNSCALDWGESKQRNYDDDVADKCVEWDMVPPSHCATTPIRGYDIYDEYNMVIGNCYEQRCNESVATYPLRPCTKAPVLPV